MKLSFHKVISFDINCILFLVSFVPYPHGGYRAFTSPSF